MSEMRSMLRVRARCTIQGAGDDNLPMGYFDSSLSSNGLDEFEPLQLFTRVQFGDCLSTGVILF